MLLEMGATRLLTRLSAFLPEEKLYGREVEGWNALCLSGGLLEKVILRGKT